MSKWQSVFKNSWAWFCQRKSSTIRKILCNLLKYFLYVETIFNYFDLELGQCTLFTVCCCFFLSLLRSGEGKGLQVWEFLWHMLDITTRISRHRYITFHSCCCSNVSFVRYKLQLSQFDDNFITTTNVCYHFIQSLTLPLSDLTNIELETWSLDRLFSLSISNELLKTFEGNVSKI